MQRRHPPQDDSKALPDTPSASSTTDTTLNQPPSVNGAAAAAAAATEPARDHGPHRRQRSLTVPAPPQWERPDRSNNPFLRQAQPELSRGQQQQQQQQSPSLSLAATSDPPTSSKRDTLARSKSSAKRSSSKQAIDDRVGGSSDAGSRRAMQPFSSKKARTGSAPPHKMEMPSPQPSAAAVNRAQQQIPPSPLFFSHKASPKPPSRPSTVPQHESTSALLARFREDSSGGVTTLKLPRASVSTNAHSGSTPGSWGSSMEVSVPSLSSDSRSWPTELQVINTNVGVLELLEQDERPTFLVNLNNTANASRPGFHIQYMNPALKKARVLLNDLLIIDQTNSEAAEEYARFKAWVLNPSKPSDAAEPQQTSYQYGTAIWTCSTLRRQFRLVKADASYAEYRTESPLPIEEEDVDVMMPAPPSREGSPALPVTPDVEDMGATDYFGETKNPVETMTATNSNMDTDMNRRHPDDFTNEVLQSQPARASFDWTRINYDDGLPDHIKFAKSIDWGATALGPIEEWPHELRAMANLIMGSPHAAAMYWGPEHIAIYNTAYIELAGKKHPSMMGAAYSVAWAEIWEEIKPIFDSAWESGQATMKHENQLFINRHGFLEEAFFSWSIVPLIGADGEVVGLYNPAFEDTRRIVAERRMLTLREIGEQTATATCINEFWERVQKGLEFNAFDVPFSMIYAVKDDVESDASSLHSGSLGHSPQLILEGMIGVPEGHPVAIDSMDLRTADAGFAPYMRQSMTMGGAPILLSREDETLPEHLLEGIEWRGFGDACNALVIFPVVPTTGGEAVVGFIVMGVNPRRPYDDDYKLFVTLLGRQLATSLASVVLFEEEIKRGQRAARLAALDRQELSTQLQLRTEEANQSEYRFTRMAEFAPVGMFIADSNGHINYCNDMWWQISRHSRAEGTEDQWLNSVRPEDRPNLEAEWLKLVNDKQPISLEFRFKHSQQNGDHNIDTWVLLSAFPERNSDGSLKSIFGCITDISSQKWAEKVQNERREEAVEMKRQQENFIDITSHEMRNPLSAILQCADQIANNITAFAGYEVKDEVEQLLEGCLDAANTINLCASHQKRIVDDILTLSKLDSNLLSVTPVDEQPVRVVQRALKMFESELVAHDIEFEFVVDQTFDVHGVKWARLDPSRLRQVLINLMTNAIKFTQGRERRLIMVSLSASKDISEVTAKGTIYFERNDDHRNGNMDIMNEDEWGAGELINIHCTVEDTGPGLSDEELKVLFQRFQQASPRTHVQYGGSGLGLFISRILTEMQGGQIGVTSRRGLGSKFSFYIQARRTVDPPADFEHISPFKIARKSQLPSINNNNNSSSATINKITITPPNPPAPFISPTQSAVNISTPPQANKPNVPPSTTATTTTTTPSQPLYDVLIVEDNIVNQKVLQRQLKNCGNNTFVANHGKEALQQLEKSRFWVGKEAEGVDISVILMDLEMPVMDGMTCARRIRELEREGVISAHIPIIAVTAYARPEQIEDAKAAGIDDVISKPFRIPELIPKIEELVEKYKTLAI